MTFVKCDTCSVIYLDKTSDIMSVIEYIAVFFAIALFIKDYHLTKSISYEDVQKEYEQLAKNIIG